MTLPDKFFEVISYEGVVSIVSWGNDEPHITNTWNSYLVILDKNKILIPAAGMHSTEKDILLNNKVKITLGSKSVEGFNGYQGTGFLITGNASFYYDGEYFNIMKNKLSFISRVIVVNVETCKQLL